MKRDISYYVYFEMLLLISELHQVFLFFVWVLSTCQASVRGKYRPYNTEALDKAYEAVIDGMSVRKAAKSFSVPFATLRDRTSGDVGIDCLKSGPDSLLSMEEERQLVVHIHIFFISKELLR